MDFRKIKIVAQKLVRQHSEVILGMDSKHVPEVSTSFFRLHVGDQMFGNVEISVQQPDIQHSIMIVGTA